MCTAAIDHLSLCVFTTYTAAVAMTGCVYSATSERHMWLCHYYFRCVLGCQAQHSGQCHTSTTFAYTSCCFATCLRWYHLAKHHVGMCGSCVMLPSNSISAL